MELEFLLIIYFLTSGKIGLRSLSRLASPLNEIWAANLDRSPLRDQLQLCSQCSGLRSIFFTPAHRSAPYHSIFGPLRSIFRSTHMPWWSVGLSVCHSSEPCKNSWTDWDAVSGNFRTLVGPRNHVLDGRPDGKGQYWGESGGPLLSIGHSAVCSDLCKKAEPVQMPFVLWAQGIVLDGDTDPPMGRGNFGGKSGPL